MRDLKDLDNITITHGCTLDEYKYVYGRFLKMHTDSHSDYDELTFIKSELNNFFLNKELDEDALAKYNDIDYRQENMQIFKNNYSNHEKNIASYNKIIDFLMSRENEIKNPTDMKLNTKTNDFEKYFSSFDVNNFDEVSNKKNTDGTLNNVYLGNNFNEWLVNINKNLISNRSYNSDTLEKLKYFNEKLCTTANDIFFLFKEVSKYKKTNDSAFKTSIYLKEKAVLNDIDALKCYAETIVIAIENKEFVIANDIKTYCLRLLNNLIVNLKDIFTINVYLSPLEIHFKHLKEKLENAIDFDNLKIISELNVQFKNNTSTNENQVKENDIKIDRNFISSLRLNTGIKTILFGTNEDKVKIVPEDLEHVKLMESREVSENSEKHYFYPTSHLVTDEFYNDFVNTGYYGKRENILYPYSLIIFGAYYQREDIYYKLRSINVNDTLNGNKVEYLSDLIPYFKEYANGFKNGFDEFNNSCIHPHLLPLSTNPDFAKEVFKYITNSIERKQNWSKNDNGFIKSFKIESRNNKEITHAFEDGRKQGYFYRAWSYVFSMNEHFAPLFDEYYNSFTNNEPQQTRLKMNEIALMYVYNENAITRDNANEIAKEYFYTSKESGEKLYQKFNFYNNRTDRKADPQTKTKLKNKINLFENVIELLTIETAKSKANSELAILKNYENNYL